jgi:hypothetical protein
VHQEAVAFYEQAAQALQQLPTAPGIRACNDILIAWRCGQGQHPAQGPPGSANKTVQ